MARQSHIYPVTRSLGMLKVWLHNYFNSRLPFELQGWRTAAVVNTILVSFVSMVMVIFSAVALIVAKGFNRPLVFFTGACGLRGASALTVFLHIIINIFSTAMLASSNMFMQILNAPSREEVRDAHARGSWLEIGVLSGRNIGRISRFRMLSWLGFFLSSIPIHLLFNSTIFETDYRSSDYDMAIVTESFLERGIYYTPGVSLLNSGSLKDSTNVTISGYGNAIDLDQYQNMASDINQRIALAAEKGGTWDRINQQTCMQYYQHCTGLTKYRNVILVVTDTAGWPRSQIWNLTEKESTFWDDLVPDDAQSSQHNSLWFYATCTMTAWSDQGTAYATCDNNCDAALGETSITKEMVIPFYPDQDLADAVVLRNIGNDISGAKPLYNFNENNLTIDHCLAEAVPESCKVVLSTTLLVCVTGCTIIKTALCVLVLYRLRSQDPLVTPGDAINSFISKSDHCTAGMCLLSQGEVRMTAFCGIPQPGPRRYHRRFRRSGVAIPKSLWSSLYFMFLVVLALPVLFTILLAIYPYGMTSDELRSFGQSDTNPVAISGIPLIRAVLIANSPHLALSMAYVVYNNVFTRLLVGREWASRSTSFSPLRVTDPRGLQRSTYRLQLPYRYSIPLITTSILLHWLLSNTVYVFVSQGDYFGPLLEGLQQTDFSLPPGSTVSVGYSIIPLIVLASVMLTGFTLPIIWAQRRLPGSITSVGCNSFAISASCHASPLAKPDAELRVALNLSDESHGNEELQELIEIGPTTSAADDDGISMEDHADKRLEMVAQSKLKLGVVRMPPEWYNSYDESYGGVGHVSFGTANDEVEEPVNGKWYA